MRGRGQRMLVRAAIARPREASWLVAAVLVLVALVLAPPATSENGMLPSGNGSGSLDRPTGGLPRTGGALNRTKWKVQAGDSIVGTIRGATDADLAGAAEADVVIKSSAFGNTTVRGSKSGTTITFAWNVPGGACSTTVVAYGPVGSN